MRGVLAAGIALALLAGCAERGGAPVADAEGAAGEPRDAARTVEPMTATALETALADAPVCAIPRLREEMLARAALADAQAQRLAVEAEMARAREEAQRPVALAPGAEDAADGTAEDAPDAAPPAPPPEMDPDMAEVLDAPETDTETAPLPAAILPGYDLSPVEAERAFACIEPYLIDAYQGSGHALATLWREWERLDEAPFLVRDAFGLRWLAAFGNGRARGEAPFEPFRDREFLVGEAVALPSFTVEEDGTVLPGALFLVEKMPRGFSGPYGNWRFTEIPVDAAPADVTAGAGVGEADAPAPVICADCTARGLDAVYLTLTRGGTAPAEDELAPLRAMSQPRTWYPSPENTPVLAPDDPILQPVPGGEEAPEAGGADVPEPEPTLRG